MRRMPEEDNDLQLEGQTAVETTGEFKFTRRSLYSALLPVAFVAGLATGYLFWGRDADPPAADAIEEPSRFDVSVDDDPALGPQDAPITIIEFSDFRCGFCAKFRRETLDALLAEYPDQIHFVYRDFPVAGGYEAALAAECADEQGAFWDFHDLLFSGEIPNLDRDAFAIYAEKLDLDVQDLLACVDEERLSEEVEADARFASSLGITGTPTFFINGIPLVGAQPLSAFIQIIEYELAD